MWGERDGGGERCELRLIVQSVGVRGVLLELGVIRQSLGYSTGCCSEWALRSECRKRESGICVCDSSSADM